MGVANTSQPFAIRSAAPSDLPAALHLRQAREIAEHGTSVTTAETLQAAWEALGDRLSAQTWLAVQSVTGAYARNTSERHERHGERAATTCGPQ